jgi:hypothetical protein
MIDASAFKRTWPHDTQPSQPDLDLKRPGRVGAETRRAVLRGAVAGPPARPERRPTRHDERRV